MPSPFPGMDPFVEKNPLFHEIHTMMLSAAMGQLQPQLLPKYIARLERHLSEGSVWDSGSGTVSLEGKEPDVSISLDQAQGSHSCTTAVLASPTISVTEELDADDLQLRKQRRITIYVNERARMAVASIELLSPSNKRKGTLGQRRYLAKRTSALQGGLHWIEIDLLREGQRPPMPLQVPEGTIYLAYVAQAIDMGWCHLLYPWKMQDAFPRLAIPLLGNDQAVLDVGACFQEAYDRAAAQAEADYPAAPPPPALSPPDAAWVDALLRQKGLRPAPPQP